MGKMIPDALCQKMSLVFAIKMGFPAIYSDKNNNEGKNIPTYSD